MDARNMKGSQAAAGRFMITFDRPKNFDLAGGTGETQIETELRKVGAQIMPPQNGKARTSFVCEVPPGFPIGAVCRLVREGLDAERGTAMVARLQDGKVFVWPISETPEARKLPRWAAITFDAAQLTPAPAAKPAPKAPVKPAVPKATPVKTTPAPTPAAASAKPPAPKQPAAKPAAPPAPVQAKVAAPKAPAPAAKAPAPKVVPPKAAAPKPAAKAPPKAAAKPPAKAKPPVKAKPVAKKPAPPMRAAAKTVSTPAVKAKKR
jgi:hypothetical protein